MKKQEGLIKDSIIAENCFPFAQFTRSGAGQ